MITENLSTLKIHKLTKAQYEREFQAGNIDPNALYLTPDESVEDAELITVDDIDAICGATVEVATLSEVTF